MSAPDHDPDSHAWALAYTESRDAQPVGQRGTRHYYIPTAPKPARTWRGPFNSWQEMVNACAAELGESLTIHTTSVKPAHLGGSNGA